MKGGVVEGETATDLWFLIVLFSPNLKILYKTVLNFNRRLILIILNKLVFNYINKIFNI